MTIEDAAEALSWWFARLPITISPEVFGRELDASHFRLGIIQVEPGPKQRIFEMVALDCADCYELREVAA